MNWDIYDRSAIASLNCTYMPTPNKTYARLTAAERRDIMYAVAEHDKNMLGKIRELCFQHAGDASNIPLNIGMKCNLSESIMRHVLNGRRSITADFLGHICVGLRLSEQESEALFELYGHPLKFGRSYFESVTICAIRDHDTIDDYDDELEKYKRKSSVQNVQ